MADALDAYDGTCAICGERGRFARSQASIRESYACPSCNGELRYQGQARVLVERYSRHGSSCVAELATEPDFKALAIWEPGRLGPFRKYLRGLRRYDATSYSPDIASGTFRDGIRYENLMAPSYPSNTFDLVITSDVFEHIRRPYVAFEEIYRVLCPGGVHLFSIPVQRPMRATTVERVDTSGDNDVFLVEPCHHYGFLVYNDFGRDLIDNLSARGFPTDALPFESANAEAAKLLTFCSTKPRTRSVVSKYRLALRHQWWKRYAQTRHLLRPLRRRGR